jgi:hypothetical protein
MFSDPNHMKYPKIIKNQDIFWPMTNLYKFQTLNIGPKTSKSVKVSPKTAKEAKNFYDGCAPDMFLEF